MPRARPSKSADPEVDTLDRSTALSRLEVQGFKSIGERAGIDIRPLTLLAGANSSGKSSMIQPLLLLKQTLELQYEPHGPLHLDGVNVPFTSVEQMLSRGGSGSLIVSLVQDNRLGVELELVRGAEGLSLDRMTYGPPRDRRTLRRDMSEAEARSALDADLLKRFPTTTVRIVRERCFLRPRLSEGLPDPASLWAAVSTRNLIRDVIHVPGLRREPSRSYPRAGVADTFTGTFKDYVASVVLHWQEHKDDRLRRLREHLQRLGLTWKIEARLKSEVEIELLVGRLLEARKGGAKDVVNLADVGLGVSQVLPVLVALLAAAPGQLVYVEQPEIHLHPRAQVALAAILAESAQRGVIAIVETHSSLLLRSLQALVAEGKLAKDLIALHWFTRDAHGATSVSTAELDDHGAFGDWPEDFGEVELGAEKRYLDAVDARMFPT
jgi:hypothetical protein